MKTFSISEKGLVRDMNQDRCCIERQESGAILLAVADGVGGSFGGEYAAQKAIETIKTFQFNGFSNNLEEKLGRLIKRAHNVICETAGRIKKFKGMGSTIALAYVEKDKITWAYLGDTRIYVFRKGKLNALTRDHTIPGLLLKEGELTREEARLHPMSHGILKCLGGADAKPDVGHCRLETHDIVFACSDGLHGLIPEKDMQLIINNENNPDKMAKRLVDAAMDAGGTDNITITGVRL